MGGGTLPTGFAGISRSSSAPCKMRFSSERHAMTVACSSSLPRSSYCHWRIEDAVISPSRRRPKLGRR